MNYEDLLGELQPLEKQMKDTTGACAKSYKNVAKYSESGDLKALRKELDNYASLLQQQTQLAEELQELVNAFDENTYLESGDFSDQMLGYFEEENMDVIGEFPTYEVFPYRLRFDTNNMEVFLNKKKLSCMRPYALVNTVKTNQEKLMKSSFNAQAFLNELAAAYDMYIASAKKMDGADVYLRDLYKILVPMGRFRKEYDIDTTFAYELARLHMNDEVEMAKGDRRYQFGTSRENKKAIRILDDEGNEHYIATIRFFK